MLKLLSTQAIANALGGDVHGRDHIMAPGPGHSYRDRSLSVWIDADDPEGFRVHSFAGDDWKECRDHVRDALRLPKVPIHAPSKNRAPMVGKGIYDNRALAIWDEAVAPHGTEVETYLRGRGLDLPPDAGDVIRFHSGLWYRQRQERMSGMVCLFRDIHSDARCGIHRTFLDHGRKVDRRMLGRADRAAIKLSPDTEVTTGLTIGEGVESTLAGYLAGFRPAWALGSAPAIAAFGPLPGIEALTILGEHNDHGANERATRACVPRWRAEGREVFKVDPLIGNDLNDAWRSAAA
jgi:hypothetical protein